MLGIWSSKSEGRGKGHHSALQHLTEAQLPGRAAYASLKVSQQEAFCNWLDFVISSVSIRDDEEFCSETGFKEFHQFIQTNFSVKELFFDK